jgi:hypothetical protein
VFFNGPHTTLGELNEMLLWHAEEAYKLLRKKGVAAASKKVSYPEPFHAS